MPPLNQSRPKNRPKLDVPGIIRGFSKLVIVGAGSELRADDNAGLLVADTLAKHIETRKLQDKALAINGGTAPENFTGVITRFGPSHIVIIDAAAAEGRHPGEVFLIDESNISGVSFSTHMLPFTMMVAYLRENIKGCEVSLVGIQPKELGFGKPMSPEVKDACSILAKTLIALL